MKKLFLTSLTKLLNTYLGLDPEIKTQLDKLQGSIITIQLDPMAFIFQLTINQQGLLLEEGEHHKADARIQGTPLQFGSVMLEKENRHHFFKDDIILEGNADIAQQVITLFDAVEIDWEEYLAKLIGDISAHKVSHFVQRTRRWLTKRTTDFTQDAKDFIQEETDWLPTRDAMDEFLQAIDELRLDVDRLEMRMHHAQKSKAS